MRTENFCFYFQNRLIQTGQTGGQWYNDTSPFSIPWILQISVVGRRLFKVYDVNVFSAAAAYRTNKQTRQALSSL
jgi:hypothetical protein